MVGAVVSTVPGSVAVALLPALSLTVALAVYSPSANGVIASTLYVPFAFTVVLTV